MIPKQARVVLSAAQLEVVERVEAQGDGVKGLHYDVMSGAVEVLGGERGRLVVATDGLQVEPRAWMSVGQALQVVARIRAMEGRQ